MVKRRTGDRIENWKNGDTKTRRDGDTIGEEMDEGGDVAAEERKEAGREEHINEWTARRYKRWTERLRYGDEAAMNVVTRKQCSRRTEGHCSIYGLY